MNYSEYTNTGGHPLQLDDLEFDQIATREALFDLARGLGQTESRFIIWGCNLNTINITSGNAIVGKQFEVSAGAVFWDDELWHFDGGITPTSNNTFAYPVLRQTLSTATPSPVAYNSGALVNVHRVRRLSLTVTSAINPGPLDFPVQTERRIPEIMRDAIAAVTKTDPWHVVGDPGEPSLLNGWGLYTGQVGSDPGYPVAFREIGDGRIALRGEVVGGSTNHVFTLPLDYRPSNPVYMAGVKNVSGSNVHDTWRVLTDGRVTVEYNNAFTIHRINATFYR